MAKVCPNCGNELKDKSTFCGKCGSKWDEKTKKTVKKPVPKSFSGIFAAYKKWFIGAGALLLAAVLLLIIINPANSPKAVFNRYLDCLHSQNEQAFREISYEANFSAASTADNAAESYKARFLSADASYKSGGKVDLLKGTEIRIIKAETPKQSEIATRRSSLSELFRNTARITDIRNITFEIKRGETTSTGTAELICVTGKWYIGEVLGI